MTKSDLQNGMVIEQRNGDCRLVLNGKMIDKHGFSELGRHTESLKSELSESLDIVKIYSVNAKSTSEIFLSECLTLLWERKEPKKMTVSEIAKELGYEIEIVK